MEDFCESRETQIFENLFGTIYTQHEMISQPTH